MISEAKHANPHKNALSNFTKWYTWFDTKNELRKIEDMSK